MNNNAKAWVDAPCGKCGGLPRIETDRWGTHQICQTCGATRVITVNLSPDLWGLAQATEGPGGARGSVLNRPFGKVLPR